MDNTFRGYRPLPASLPFPVRENNHQQYIIPFSTNIDGFHRKRTDLGRGYVTNLGGISKRGKAHSAVDNINKRSVHDRLAPRAQQHLGAFKSPKHDIISPANSLQLSSLQSANCFNDFYPELTHEIQRFHERNCQTEDVLANKRRLCNRVYDVSRELTEIRVLGHRTNMFLVGSSMNGCASKSSDVDLCLYLDSDIGMDRKTTIRILQKLCVRFRRCGEFGNVLFIRATVPILKFFDHVTGFECDLNINNSVGIRNTHLLKAYCLVDDRIPQLMFAVKYWARHNGVNDAANGTFNSYSLALLTIFFLQVGVSPAICPVLQQQEQEMFSARTPVENLPRLDLIKDKYQSSNQMNLGELFHRFIQFYNTSFDFDKDIASCRIAQVIKRHTKSEDQWTKKFICIEEPFEESNTARAVYSEDKYKTILAVFRETYQKLERAQRLTCFSCDT